MKIIERVKGIILQPVREWEIIAQEKLSDKEIFGFYLFPLALLPTIGAFIGYGLIGLDVPFAGHVGSVGLGIRQAAVQMVSIVAGVYISAFVINALAPTFGTEKSFARAFALISYSYTPMLVSGILLIFPALGIIVIIASIYGLYLLYIGLRPMMGVSVERVTGYYVISLIVVVLLSIVISAIFSRILLANQLW